jgi:hypothetical protein
MFVGASKFQFVLHETVLLVAQFIVMKHGLVAQQVAVPLNSTRSPVALVELLVT